MHRRAPPIGQAGIRDGGATRSPLLVALIPFLVVGCGYRSIYAAGPPGRLHVKVIRSLVADAVAADEVASGMREELARSGALAPGEGYPRVEIEVLRADETSDGIAAGSSGPIARGTRVAMVARAWVTVEDGAAPQAETGDMTAEESITVDETGGAGGTGEPDPRASSFHHADASRAAARRLGRKLGARVLGQPSASEDTGN
jgi:hypothetical protein